MGAMTTTRTASRILTALASGLATTAWYATPDVIASRTARGWAKAGLAAGALAVELPQLRAERASRRAAAVDVPGSSEGPLRADGPSAANAQPRAAVASGAGGAAGAGGTAGVGGTEPAPPGTSRRRAVALGVLVVAGAASVAGTVAAERWIFRRGEARAAAGVRFAHTRTAAVLGALTVVLALVPPPTGDDADDPAGAGARTA